MSQKQLSVAERRKALRIVIRAKEILTPQGSWFGGHISEGGKS